MNEAYVSPQRAALTACRRLARLRQSRLRHRVRQDRFELRQVACEEAKCHLMTLPAAEVAVAGDDTVTIAYLPVVSTVVTTRRQQDEETRLPADRALLASLQDPACAVIFGG